MNTAIANRTAKILVEFAAKEADPFDGAQLTREIILLRSPATAPEKKLLRG
jgi:hypothetical protein